MWLRLSIFEKIVITKKHGKVFFICKLDKSILRLKLGIVIIWQYRSKAVI